MQSENREELIRRLEDGGEYRILRKLGTTRVYNQPDGSETKLGVFLDLETTGLNYLSAEIIEIALVPFRYSSDGRIFDVLEPFNQFQKPKKCLIPDEITKITGITNDMVKGHKIDAVRLVEIVS